MFTRHFESTAVVPAPAATVFTHLDAHARLSGHMSESSWRMGGGRMQVETDSGGGRCIGSHIRLAGRAFGIRLAVEEVVTHRDPPYRKVWETVGSPQLLVIGPYRMGFELVDGDAASRLRVFIDFALPARWDARWFGSLLAGWYARWCTRRMVADAMRRFMNPGGVKPREAITASGR